MLAVRTVQDVTKAVEGMSGGQRQALAIGRAVNWGRGVVILDEPVAALGILETEQVLQLIVDLKTRGISIILVSHNLEHVFRVADRILVMYQGRSVAELRCQDTDTEDLSKWILTGGIQRSPESNGPIVK